MKKILGIILTSGLILVSTPAPAHNGVAHKTPKRG